MTQTIRRVRRGSGTPQEEADKIVASALRTRERAKFHQVRKVAETVWSAGLMNCVARWKDSHFDARPGNDLETARIAVIRSDRARGILLPRRVIPELLDQHDVRGHDRRDKMRLSRPCLVYSL